METRLLPTATCRHTQRKGVLDDTSRHTHVTTVLDNTEEEKSGRGRA